MTIKPDMCWFEIVEITMFNINEVTRVNDEYIDKSYTRVSNIINNA